MPSTQNITGYVQQETRSFDQLPLSDADLAVFTAVLYGEFERYPEFSPETVMTLGDLSALGDLRLLVEHDYNPKGMLPFFEALVVSPRFAPVILRQFQCVVDQERCIQFAAVVFDISQDESVIAFRGTDAKHVGWREDFRMPGQEAMPSQVESLRYLEESCRRDPERRFALCGHSKGGACAEYAAIFANEQIADRILRVVSFDSPSLLRASGDACPQLRDFEQEVCQRYAAFSAPMTRYVFRGMVGLMLEEGDLSRFPFVDCVDSKLPHNMCSARIENGALALREPNAKNLKGWSLAARVIGKLNQNQRLFLADFVVDAFERAGVVLDFGLGIRRIISLLWQQYRSLEAEGRAALRGILRKVFRS